MRWLGCCSGDSVIRWWRGGDSVIFGLGFLLKHGVVVVGFSVDFWLGLGFSGWW